MKKKLEFMEVIKNKIILIYSLVLLIFVFSCTRKNEMNFNNPETFGEYIFTRLVKKEHMLLKEITVNENDYNQLLNKSKLNLSLINRFRNDLLPELLKAEEFKFIQERSYFFNVICDTQDINFLRVENKKNINPFGFDVSDIIIIYTCNGNSEERKIYVESIKTLDGWKIMSNIY